jgi:hypothetical protein
VQTPKCAEPVPVSLTSVPYEDFANLGLKDPKSRAKLTSMKSALGVFLGVSVLALAVGCDNGGDDTDGNTAGKGPINVGGSAGSGTGGSVIPNGGSVTTTAGTGTGGSGGTGTPAAGVPLTPTDGWVDGASNTLMVQGAMFAYADETSKMGMTEDFVGTHACIKGTAAKVDLKCTPVAPATDCYGTFWGAAIGLNMNQPIDMTTMMGADPMPFDASSIKGFGFTISGMMVPTSLRFKVEDAAGEYCTPTAKPVKLGANTFMLSDLIKECWTPKMGAATAESAKSGIVKIAWQVVTDAKGTIPFDYCVESVVAIQ